jgi:ferredoxin
MAPVEVRPNPSELADPATEARLRNATMRVWIDQDLCTGDGICEDLCPDVFVILEDGIAYVHDGHQVMNDPGGHTGLARIAPHDEDAVVAAAHMCPGECIFIEIDDRHC